MNSISIENEFYFKKIKGNYIKTTPRKLRMVDLFAGTGGFTLAFTKSKKVNVIMANDFCDKSEKIYKHNFPNHSFINKDLNDIDSKTILNILRT